MSTTVKRGISLRARLEVGGGYNIDVKRLPNWALERLRAGEHPATVLQALVPKGLLRGESPTEGEAIDITGRAEAPGDGTGGRGDGGR